MELEEFLRQTQADVRSQIMSEQTPFSEHAFADVVMQHLASIGMTSEPQICQYQATVGNAQVRLTGYALSEEGDQLDLFVSLYSGLDEVMPIPDSETKMAAEQCLRFLSRCAQGRLASTMDPSTDAYAFAFIIQESYPKIDQISIYVLTDRQSKAKSFVPRDVQGKTVKLEVIDIERLYRHWSEGKPRDELVVNFDEVCGTALPCVYVPSQSAPYDYALTVVPGEALRFMYEKYGARLLEANVRSFLSATGKVNRGIRDTLRDNPEMFFAYNNGIVMIADEADIAQSQGGGHGIRWMKGVQIVNGGQTTASIYFSKKRQSDIDLSLVRVPAKVIILHKLDSNAEKVDEEDLISSISRYANSQNAVKQADLSANKPFHIAMEKLSTTTFCPDGTSRWFYERAAGSYNVMLAKEGTTPARLRLLKEAIPSTRKITKTDLAKYLNAWNQKPHVVSWGSQKNFAEFMDDLGQLGDPESGYPDTVAYKKMIGQAILFKTVSKLVRPLVPAFQANVASYLVAVVANKVGAKFDFDRVWRQQDLSPELKAQLMQWVPEVNQLLQQSANGRMISEWAKKPECWDFVKKGHFSSHDGSIPELRG